MKPTLLALSIVCAVCSANAALDMDHVSGPTSNLTTTPDLSVVQVMNDFPTMSGTVVDDFVMSGATVDTVSLAFETSESSFDPTTIGGWRVSIWASVNDAATSGNSLTGNTLATTIATGGTYTELFGTGASGRAFRVDFTGLSLTAGTGVRYIGAAAMFDFANGGQTFLLSNTAPALLGNGTANDAYGINPGNGFLLGTSVALRNNAAYTVTTVPEPASMAALAAGLVALARRRRR